jgi:hypothetical protein
VTLPSVHLTSLVSEENPTCRRLASLARTHAPSGYRLARSRCDADIILFVESGYFGLGSIAKFHAVSRQNGSARHFVFSEGDWPFAYIPGLYCSLTKRLPWAFSWAYLLDDAGPAAAASVAAPYLFSFLGRKSTHPVREGIVRCLDSRQTPCLDVASGAGRFRGWDYRETYALLLANSRFVLCPRGIGSSSIRIFDAMRAGRVPVIISDAWIEPPVGEWARFSIRVPEGAIERIPQICERHLDAAPAMGDLARRTFEEYFSPAKFLDAALDFLRSTAPAHASYGDGFARPARALSAREFRTVAHRAWHRIRRAGASLG